MDNGAGSYRRFLSGDEAAFDDIIKEYFERLVFFINRYTHDLSAAEDIAQDTLADLIVHRHRYNFRVKLITYLCMTARSRALNYLKRSKRTVLYGEPVETDAYSDEADPVTESLLVDERDITLHRAIDTLPYDMRAAVHLVYFDGLSYRETAAVLKKTPKQVDNLLYRAKLKLRDILGKEGELLL